MTAAHNSGKRSLAIIEDGPVRNSIKKRKEVFKASPWGNYHRFMKLDQAGIATIAYYDAGPRDRYKLVAIKEEKLRWNKSSL